MNSSLNRDRPLQVDVTTGVSEAVVASVVELIREGALEPGAPLPPERELAALFGVSRGSLREAIRVLAYAGVLEVRTRAGTYIAEAAITKGSLLRAHGALIGQESPLDIMVARRALEPVSARYAAVHRHVADLKAIKKSARDQRLLIDRGDNPQEAFRQFHLAIANASHNALLSALFEVVATAMSQDTLKHKSGNRTIAGRQDLYLDQHVVILEAITSGDSLAAERAMAEHLDTVEAELLAVVE